MARLTSPKSTPHDSSNRRFWYVFGFAIAICGALSITIGLQQSLWFDDAYSVELARRSVAQLVHLTSLDVHPPTYYLLLKAWGHIFGWGDLAMRSLSVLFTMAALAVGGLLIRKMFGNRIAIGAVLMLMLAPLIMRYSFEVRMYAMASFIGISATYALYSAWQSRGRTKLRWLIVYGFFVALGLYTLYALALLWIAHAIWLAYLWCRRRVTLKGLLPYIATFLATAVVFVPWLPTFMSQLTNGALGPIVEPLKLDQIIGILTFNTIYQPTASVNVPQTALVIALIGVYIWAIPRAYRKLRTKHSELALLAFYMAIPIVVMMLVSLIKAMYVERYLSHVSIGMMLLGGVVLVAAVDPTAVKQGTGKLRHLAHYLPYIIVYGTLIVGVINLWNTGNYSFQHLYKPSARSVVARIGSCPAKNTMILTDTPYTATEIWYYLPNCAIHFTSGQAVQTGGMAPWSGSKNQVKDTADLTVPRVIYISYGTPNHPLPDSYHETHSFSDGAMDVSYYQRS